MTSPLIAGALYIAARYFRTESRNARAVNRVAGGGGQWQRRGKHFEPFARDDSITTGLEMGHVAQTLNAA